MNHFPTLSRFSYLTINAIFLFMLLPGLLNGCGVVFVAGASAGAYSYYSGNVTRTYTAGYRQTINTCVKVLKQMDISIVNKSGDALKTTIKSKRYDDTDITIEIEKIGSNLSRVNIRTGLVGVDNKTDSEFIHEYIADEFEKPGTPVKSISPQSYKVKISPDDTEYNPTTLPQKKSASYEREQKEISAETEISAGEQPMVPPRNPFYIFYTDKEIEIPQTALTQINSSITFLRDNPSSTIDIKSYTDSNGTAEDNLDLSWKRANVMKDYLIQHGISYERITARGFGASNFLESNKTETLRKMNRRLVLYIQP